MTSELNKVISNPAFPAVYHNLNERRMDYMDKNNQNNASAELQKMYRRHELTIPYYFALCETFHCCLPPILISVLLTFQVYQVGTAPDITTFSKFPTEALPKYQNEPMMKCIKSTRYIECSHWSLQTCPWVLSFTIKYWENIGVILYFCFHYPEMNVVIIMDSHLLRLWTGLLISLLVESQILRKIQSAEINKDK